MARKLKFDLTVEANALLCPNSSAFYSKCYINEDDINNYRVIPGVKETTKISNVLFEDVLQEASCPWASTDAILDSVDITTCPLSVMVQICQFDLESSFVALSMAKGSGNSLNVPEFMAYYWDELAKEVKQEISILRWKGDTAGGTGNYLELCDGYEKKFTADAAIVDVVGTTVTSANVLTEIAKVYASLATNAPACLNSDDLRIYMSANVYAAYKQAVAAGNTLAYVTKALGDTYLDIPIVVSKGMSANTMVMTDKNNLIYAVDDINDETALKAVNLMETVVEPVIRTRTDIKVGFNYVNPEQIIFYS